MELLQRYGIPSPQPLYLDEQGAVLGIPGIVTSCVAVTQAESPSLKWVWPMFARLLIESSYDTAEKVANSNYEELYLNLVRTNEEKGIYKGGFGMEDLWLWVEVVAQDVPQVIQYSG